MSDIRTATPRPLARPRPSDPRTDRRIARVHLRMGNLGLARAELEALAGAGQLDDAGLLALAEARWRTGDLTGAGEAAQAHLGNGGEALIALVIAAEAVAAVGRPGEARRLSARALERADVPLDRIFAGMPRSLIWPADPSVAGSHAGTLFEDAGPAGQPGRATAESGFEVPSSLGAAPIDEPGFWDVDDADGTLPDPADALEAAERALDADDLPTAAVHLAIVLRIAPGLAPAVLDAAGRAPRASAELNLVRGDAYRLVGHEADAQRAYASAAASLAHRLHARPNSKGGP